jgi:hypothetical protein
MRKRDDGLGISWDDMTSAFSGGSIVYVVIGLIGFIILVGILIAIKQADMRCSVCGVPIIRVSYIWGKSRMCPRCDSRMRKKLSKEAFKSKFG